MGFAALYPSYGVVLVHPTWIHGNMAFPNKRLVWAVVASATLHIGLLFGPPIPLPQNPAPIVLEARLENAAPPPPPAIPQAKPRPKPRPKPSMPPAVRAEPLAPAAESPPPDIPPTVQQPGSAEPVAQVQAAQTPEAPAPAQTTLPLRAELRYALFKGDNGLNVGKVVQTWKRDGDAYALTSTAEATGLFSLFVSGQHLQVSQGRITASGLQPERFSMQRGSVEKSDAARFDWAGQTLYLTSEGRESSAKLVPGVLDMLSFAYQFAFSLPESGDIRVSLTNGRKLDSYSYRIVAEESLETPLGVLKTLHLSKLHNPGEDGTEIWLGMDYHYLPVKIRQIDKKGDSAEQVITEIRYE